MALDTFFIALSWHYIKDPDEDRFPRIYGQTWKNFVGQVDHLCRLFTPVTLHQVIAFVQGDQIDFPKKAILLTFDDGLQEHSRLVAPFLHSKGIPATFFVPSCILERQPANPQILHYALAQHGLKRVVGALGSSLDRELTGSNVHQKIDQLKEWFLYLEPLHARKVLIELWNELFEESFFDCVHMNDDDLASLKKLNHTIGAHTHTHLSLGLSQMSSELWQQEIDQPRHKLERVGCDEVNALAYPFGEDRDVLHVDWQKRLSDAGYAVAFSIEEKLNSRDTNPYNLGRFMPHSQDTCETLDKKIESVIHS